MLLETHFSKRNHEDEIRIVVRYRAHPCDPGRQDLEELALEILLREMLLDRVVQLAYSLGGKALQRSRNSSSQAADESR